MPGRTWSACPGRCAWCGATWTCPILWSAASGWPHGYRRRAVGGWPDSRTCRRWRRPSASTRCCARWGCWGPECAASALGQLSLPEQHVPRLGIRQGPARAGQHLQAPLHGRALGDLVEPAFEVRVVGHLHALVLPGPQPWEDGDVGNAVGGAAQVGRMGQPLVDDRVEPFRLVGVALDGIGQLLLGIDPEVMGLAQHGPDAAHLEHQPLQHFVLAAGVGRQQPPGLAGEVEQDGAALEQRDGRAIGALGVGDGRDLVVRADGEEVGRELVAGADVHGKHPVGQATLLKHDVHLVAVRGGP
mmetsp:Transcript_5361/g.20336  ORF Transcript_5361/g.20336 Transcript_5361/m.20336 type:complete len:301 (-) Transcript_5361:269-1171(-)